MLYPARNHKEKQGFEAKNEGKTRWKNRKCRINPTPRPESYTLSFTRNYQYIKGLSKIGVGNVGFFSKTFFGRRGRTGSGNAKHRTSLRQTSVLSRQNIGTLPSRSPMFLVSGRAAHQCRRSCRSLWKHRLIHRATPFPYKKGCKVIDLTSFLKHMKGTVDNAIFVSCARHNPNKFGFCARLAKRWYCYLRFFEFADEELILQFTVFKKICALRLLASFYRMNCF